MANVGKNRPTTLKLLYYHCAAMLKKKRKHFSSCIEIIVKTKMISCPSDWQRRSLVAKNSRYTLSGLLNFLSGLLNFFVRFAQSFVRFAQSFVRFAQIFVAPAFRQNRLNIAQVNIFVSNFYIFTHSSPPRSLVTAMHLYIKAGFREVRLHLCRLPAFTEYTNYPNI